MINITDREFNSDVWNNMVIEANTSINQQSGRKYICRVIYPDATCTLESKTDKQIKKHFQIYGNWSANCGKMSFHEIINITRITSLNTPVKADLKDPLKQALNNMAARAEAKYNGFLGSVRKIISLVFNWFAGDYVSLFSMPDTNVRLEITKRNNRGKLPSVVGNNADFARLVAKQL